MTPEQLKESILQYAMEGKLVSQDPNDEPASVLLEKARNELDEAVRKKRIRKEKYNRAVKPENYPTNWEVTRLIEICAKVKGAIKRGPFGSSITKAMFVPKSKNTFKVYEQGNAIRKTTDYGEYYMPDSEFERLKSFEVHAGDIIISCAGTIGEAFVIPKTFERGIINQALMKLTIDENIIDKQFFLLVFKSITGQLKEHSKGSAIKNLASLKYLKNEVTFPLPPLAEQKRIVERLDQIMPLVDKYAEAYNRLQEIDKGIGDRLKKSLLQYAMEGKLVDQDPNDEPASELLKRIRTEKSELIKKGKIKKSKKLPEITEDEKPFDIPDSWEWVRLGELLKPESKVKPTKNFTYVDIASLDNKVQKIISPKYVDVSKDKIPVRATQLINRNDILYSLVRPYLKNVAIVPKKFDGAIATSGFCVLKPLKESLTQYLFWALLSPYTTDEMHARMKGLNSPSIKKGDLIGWPIPLPPLVEQKRIVTKLSKLFKQVDILQKDLEAKSK